MQTSGQQSQRSVAWSPRPIQAWSGVEIHTMPVIATGMDKEVWHPGRKHGLACRRQ